MNTLWWFLFPPMPLVFVLGPTSERQREGRREGKMNEKMEWSKGAFTCDAHTTVGLSGSCSLCCIQI